ncbi:hypothetical protein C356_00625 [Cryptococcus neoformans c45]|nr:hypothetical protein C356_00625 [Cryptococcus neoformans var. grubii c45]
MLRNALCSGGVLALIKFYAHEEEGHGLHRTPDVVDEDITLISETKTVRSKPTSHVPMDRWDRTVSFKVMGSSGDESGKVEGPEVYLTKGMVDEEEIQDARYDVLRTALLEDPDLDMSLTPFLDLIQTLR